MSRSIPKLVVSFGQHQMCCANGLGFRRKKNGTLASPKIVKQVHGFRTGDMVKPAALKGKYQQGTHIGQLTSVRASGNLSIKTKTKTAINERNYP